DPAYGVEVGAGGTIEYALSVTVTGGELPIDVVLTDTLSAGQTLVPGSLPTPACSSAAGAGGTTVVTCTLAAGALPAANPHVFTYSATVDADATGNVSNNVVPSTGTCTTCSTTHPIASPEVTYNKEADTAGPVSVGDTITYTLTATVSESQLVTDLVLTDTLGTGLTFGTVGAQTSTDAANPTPFVCTGELECTLAAGTLPGTYTVAYTATVNAEAVGQVSNAVVGNQGDCEVDCEIDVPVEDPSVTYNKEADTAGPVSVGDTITYTLTATVSESQLVTDLVLTDTLGTGLTFGTV